MIANLCCPPRINPLLLVIVQLSWVRGVEEKREVSPVNVTDTGPTTDSQTKNDILAKARNRLFSCAIEKLDCILLFGFLPPFCLKNNNTLFYLFIVYMSMRKKNVN